ncbi:MAG: S-methyl-5-thioribose-1-phosphate isomerase [Planctomycetes bacterium]|nr:S-methyl-5-thioribose-1-phosphate isomerase [Planctomycetota bacterium]
MAIKTIQWIGGIDGHVEIIDQTLLPRECVTIKLCDVKAMWQAIKTLQVRGAPAIGIAAAYGVVLGLGDTQKESSLEQARHQLQETCEYLAASRPTAVNLAWALERLKRVSQDSSIVSSEQLRTCLLTEAQAIHAEDISMCKAIGTHGSGLIPDGSSVLTHCNAGGLATSEYGTALALMYSAHESGKRFQVYVDETRPLMQGSRLTAWELQQAKMDVTLICDNMAGMLMAQGKVDLIITGADRIAANGDTANKIGTYTLAVLAKSHQIPFYIAAPSSTFDLSLTSGDEIPIEERSADEITHPWGLQLAPPETKVYNPAFDVTPHEYITAIITERGVIEKPNTDKIKAMMTTEKILRQD